MLALELQKSYFFSLLVAGKVVLLQNLSNGEDCKDDSVAQ